jgi:hypothetical protein
MASKKKTETFAQQHFEETCPNRSMEQQAFDILRHRKQISFFFTINWGGQNMDVETNQPELKSTDAFAQPITLLFHKGKKATNFNFSKLVEKKQNRGLISTGTLCPTSQASFPKCEKSNKFLEGKTTNIGHNFFLKVFVQKGFKKTVKKLEHGIFHNFSKKKTFRNDFLEDFLNCVILQKKKIVLEQPPKSRSKIFF